MKKLALNVCIFSLSIINAYSQEFSEWRGPRRTGIYNESNLLKIWPSDGPKMLWFNDSLPDGHSSVAIANNSIYITGKVDSLDVLVAMDLNGKIKWKISYGRSWNQSFPESRCTPTVEEDRIYVSSGMGDIACVDANNGKIIWSLKAATELGVKFNDWGVAESLIIKGDKLYFSPVGIQTSTIAMDKLTGEIIWKSESIRDSLAYVSPILINYAGKDFIVNIAASFVYAVNADNGQIMWKFNHKALMPPPEDWAPIIKCTTPLYSDGKIYFTGGYNHIGAMLKMNDDASDVKLLWTDTTLDNHHGGVLKIGNYIYGANWINNSNGNWCCIDWETGKAKYETKWKNKGSIISADDMLYCYEEKTGNLALVPVNPEKFEIASSFKIPYGKGPYWSHPVIKHGVLYVRHGTALMAYSIKKE